MGARSSDGMARRVVLIRRVLRALPRLNLSYVELMSFCFLLGMIAGLTITTAVVGFAVRHIPWG